MLALNLLATCAYAFLLPIFALVNIKYQSMKGLEHFLVAESAQFPVKRLVASSVKTCSAALVLMV